jgi:hypothetical protein
MRLNWDNRDKGAVEKVAFPIELQSRAESPRHKTLKNQVVRGAGFQPAMAFR